MVSLFASSSLAENMVDLRFVSFPKDAQPSHLELLVGETSTIKIQVPTNRISQTYQVPAMDTWVIGTRENTGGELVFNSLGSAQAIDSEQQLILILPSGDASERLRLMPVDTSSSGFHGGRHLLVNQTQDRISGVFGDQEFSLEKGEYAILDPEQAGAREKKTSATIAVYLGDKKRPFFASAWRVSPKARSVVLFYNHPETQLIRLHSIRDYLKTY